MTATKTRASNIELLRICSMLFIVIYHFFLHAIQPNNPDLADLMKPILAVLHIGVICFVLISGYWGIKFSLKGFFKLFIQCSFYSIILYLFHITISPESFDIKYFIKSIFPFQWWFIQIYLCLYLLSPIINIPLTTTSSQKKLIYIALLGVISFGLGQFVPSLSDGKNPINFVFIYYIGNFIRYNLKLSWRLNTKKLCLMYVTFNLLLFFSLLVLSEFAFIRNALFRLSYPYNSIGLIVNAVLFFLVFYKLSITSKFINWLAASTLPVYLLHESPYLGKYIYEFVNRMQHWIEAPIIFILAILALAISIFFVCVLIDKLVNPVIKIIENTLFNAKLFTRLNSKMELILLESKKDQP